MSDHEKIQPMLTAYESGILSEEQRQDVETHLLECDVCFEDLYEFAPATEEMRRQRLQSRTFRKPRREAYRYLMAAVLVVIAAAGLWIYRLTTGIEEPAVRGSDAIALHSPAEGQNLTGPILFQWKDRTNADEYLISISDDKGSLVYQQRVKVTECTWKPTTAHRPGIYRWKVDVYLSDGTHTASSKIAEFHLK